MQWYALCLETSFPTTRTLDLDLCKLQLDVFMIPHGVKASRLLVTGTDEAQYLFTTNKCHLVSLVCLLLSSAEPPLAFPHFLVNIIHHGESRGYRVELKRW